MKWSQNVEMTPEIRLAAITVLFKLVSATILTPDGVHTFEWNSDDCVNLASMIRSLHQLGDSPMWTFTIEEWAKLVEEADNPDDAEFTFWGGRLIAMRAAL